MLKKKNLNQKKTINVCLLNEKKKKKNKYRLGIIYIDIYLFFNKNI